MNGRRPLRSVPLLGWGVVLLVSPTETAATLAGRPTPPAWLVRVLGARQVVQELVLLAVPTPAVARTAAAIDAVHASSMLVAAAVAPRYRRAALTSAAVAAVAAGVELPRRRWAGQDDGSA